MAFRLRRLQIIRNSSRINARVILTHCAESTWLIQFSPVPTKSRSPWMYTTRYSNLLLLCRVTHRHLATSNLYLQFTPGSLVSTNKSSRTEFDQQPICSVHSQPGEEFSVECFVFVWKQNNSRPHHGSLKTKRNPRGLLLVPFYPEPHKNTL